MRLIRAWLAYQMVMRLPISWFRPGTAELRWWASALLPYAGDWSYRDDGGRLDKR